jgi:hypothetical protein
MIFENLVRPLSHPNLHTRLRHSSCTEKDFAHRVLLSNDDTAHRCMDFRALVVHHHSFGMTMLNKMELEYSEWILAVRSTLGFVDTMLFRSTIKCCL